MKVLLKQLIAIIAVIIMAGMVSAAADVGHAKIVKVEGTVTMKRRGGDKAFKVVKGMKLVEGDILYTKEKSAATVVFGSHDQVTVGENSIVGLDEIEQLSNGKTKTGLSLKKGSVFSNIKRKLQKKESFTIRTSNAVAGIRGTEFYVKYDGDKTLVHVLRGKVKLESARNKKHVMVKTGELGIAEIVLKPYILRSGSTEGIIEDIKDDFPAGLEMLEFTYDENGKNEKLTEEANEGNHSVQRIFDPEDPIQTEEETDDDFLWVINSPTTGRIRVIGDSLFNISAYSSVTINGVAMTPANATSGIDIVYTDKLEIHLTATTPHFTPYNGLALQSSSMHASTGFPIVKSSGDTVADIRIPKSRYDFSSDTTITLYNLY